MESKQNPSTKFSSSSSPLISGSRAICSECFKLSEDKRDPNCINCIVFRAIHGVKSYDTEPNPNLPKTFYPLSSPFGFSVISSTETLPTHPSNFSSPTNLKRKVQELDRDEEIGQTTNGDSSNAKIKVRKESYCLPDSSPLTDLNLEVRYII